MRLIYWLTFVLLTTVTSYADVIYEPTYNSQFICLKAMRGNGETLYHANGRVMTYYAGHSGATWYHSNGAVMSYSALNTGATVYYANGRVLSYSTGSTGATWYHENGKVLSYSMGSKGATWYDENGSVLTYDGPALSKDEMWEMACNQALQ